MAKKKAEPDTTSLVTTDAEQEQNESAPEAGVTEETVVEEVNEHSKALMRQIVVEPIEPTDEEIIKAMSDSACAIRSGVGTHDRRGVEARARELLAMLRAFQDLYRSR